MWKIMVFIVFWVKINESKKSELVIAEKILKKKENQKKSKLFFNEQTN